MIHIPAASSEKKKEELIRHAVSFPVTPPDRVRGHVGSPEGR